MKCPIPVGHLLSILNFRRVPAKLFRILATQDAIGYLTLPVSFSAYHNAATELSGKIIGAEAGKSEVDILATPSFAFCTQRRR